MVAQKAEPDEEQGESFYFLSTSTLTLANTFLEDDYRLGFKWRAGKTLINLEFG